MEFSAREIAEIVGGTIEGNPEVKVSNLSKIEEGKKGTLTFLGNLKYESYLYNTEATIVMTGHSFSPSQPVPCTLIRVQDPYAAFATLLEAYNKYLQKKPGISEKSSIAPTAKLGNNVYIGDFTVLGENVVLGDNVKLYPQVYLGDNVTIGDNTIIYPGVQVYAGSIIGNNCIFHSGVVIGADGFGFAMQADKTYKKIAQIGNVIIGNDVEVGPNSSIDRATIGSTIIHDGVKINNLVQIAHNVEVMENVILAAQVGIAGSSRVGKNCVFGGQVGISDHLTIADDVKIAAQSGIAASIDKPGSIVMGSPAFDIQKFKRSHVVFKNLAEIQQIINQLKSLIPLAKDK